MRLFLMVRDEDVTGVSGTGVVAEGVEFTDGTTVIRWRTESGPQSTVVWDVLADARKVHGHDGRTRFEFNGLNVDSCLRRHVED
jgi:hypothetical protein